MAEQIFRDVPALVFLIDDGGHVFAIGLRHFDIVKESLAKWRCAGNQLDRLGRDALAGHIEQQERNAFMLLVLVGAGQAENPVGLIGIAGPDFLAVDQIMVALIDRAGLQRGQIGTGARLGIALTPAYLSASNLRQEMFLLRFGAEVQQCGAKHPDAKARQR